MKFILKFLLIYKMLNFSFEKTIITTFLNIKDKFQIEMINTNPIKTNKIIYSSNNYKK